MTILRKSIYKKLYYSVALMVFLNISDGVASNEEIDDQELQRAIQASRESYALEQQNDREIIGAVTAEQKEYELAEDFDKKYSTILRQLEDLESLDDTQINWEYSELISPSTGLNITGSVQDLSMSMIEVHSFDFKKGMHAERIRNLEVQLSKLEEREEKADKNRHEAQVRPLDNPESDEVHRIIGEVMKSLRDSYDADLLRIKRENRHLFTCILEPKTVEFNDRMEEQEPDFIEQQYGRNSYQNTLLPEFHREQEALKAFARRKGVTEPDRNQVVNYATAYHQIRKEVAEKAYAMIMGD